MYAVKTIEKKGSKANNSQVIKMTKLRNKSIILNASKGKVDAAKADYHTTLIEIQRAKRPIKRMRLKSKAKKQRKKIKKKMKQEVKASTRHSKKTKKAEKVADKLLKTQEKIQQRTP